MQVHAQLNKPTLGGREWTRVDKAKPPLETKKENIQTINKKDIEEKTENEIKPISKAKKQKQAKEKKGGEKEKSESKGPVLDDKDHAFINFCNLHVNLMLARLGRFNILSLYPIGTILQARITVRGDLAYFVTPSLPGLQGLAAAA